VEDEIFKGVKTPEAFPGGKLWIEVISLAGFDLQLGQLCHGISDS
jgi:hypothetical protein